MGRYFFHSVTADGEMKDDVGVEVDDMSLQREALTAVFELQTELDVRVGDANFLGFRVVNELGRTVMELTLQDTVFAFH